MKLCSPGREPSFSWLTRYVGAQLLWLAPELKTKIKNILGHPYAGARIRYWKDGTRIAWILNEIGKVEPITIGIITSGSQIEKVDILVYRESRGHEVGNDFFLEQFNQARLAKGQKLDRNIDNITGATLSVGSVTRTSRLALFLSEYILSQDQN